MYKCHKCNKEFKYESKLNEHKNRKIACDAPKKEYKCECCRVKFISPAEQRRHENTKKHINNITMTGDYAQSNINGDNIQNIINLTLNVNSFKDTDMSYIGKGLINDIGNYIYLEKIEEVVRKVFS